MWAAATGPRSTRAAARARLRSFQRRRDCSSSSGSGSGGAPLLRMRAPGAAAGGGLGRRRRPYPFLQTTTTAPASSRALSTAAASNSAGGEDPQSPSLPEATSGGARDPSAVAEAAGSWHAFIYDSVPVQGMQAALEAVQATTGLPWWASIALSTLAFRTALLPVARYQARAVARLARAGPMLLALNQAFSARLDKIKPGDVKSTTEACRAYAAGGSAALKTHRVSLLAAVASPLVQLPVFVTFALANRRMIDTAVPGLDAGGLAWFEDLTEPDPLLLLPLACLGSTYLNLELGFAKLHASQTILRFVKDNLQLLLLLGAPVTATLPAGVFVYWLTSSLYGHAQHFALQNPAVRAALGFPPLLLAPPPSSSPAAAAGPPVASGGMVVDPRLMAKAVEALEAYEARRRRQVAAESGGQRTGDAEAKAGSSDGSSSGKGSSAPPGLSAFPVKK